MGLSLIPILTKPLEQGANPNPNFGYKLTTAVFWDDFGGTQKTTPTTQYFSVLVNTFSFFSFVR